MADTNLIWLGLSRRSSVTVIQESNIPLSLRSLKRTPQLIMLVRGHKYSHDKAGYVQLRSMGESILLDCSLRFQPNPVPGNMPHFIIDSTKLTQDEIVDRIYSLILAPICPCIVFRENEFRSIDEIIGILARWADITNEHRCLRPLVLIHGQPGISCKDLKNRITRAFNKKFKTKDAGRSWKEYFMDIAPLYGGDNDSDLCQRAIKAIKDSPYCDLWGLPSAQIFTLMHSVCEHARGLEKSIVFDNIVALRDSPFPRVFSTQITKLLGYQEPEPELWSLVVASAISMDWYLTGTKGFSPSVAFDAMYASTIDSAHYRTVKEAFLNFTQSQERPRLVRCHLDILLKVGKAEVDIMVCLSCFSNDPSFRLACGHRLCGPCLWRYQTQPGKCLFCGGNSKIYRKPPAAGIRVLSLNGLEGGNPRAIAEALIKELESLQSELGSPLWHYFDLIIARGIGLYLALMLLYASFEDRRYHIDLQKLERVPKEYDDFKFGPALEFAAEDFLSDKVLIKQRNSKRTKQIAHRYWPCDQVEIKVHCRSQHILSGNSIPLTTYAEELRSLLFYAELIQTSPTCIPPRVLTLAIRCRLPPGNHLIEFVETLHAGGCLLECNGTSQDLACTEDVLKVVRNREAFKRTLNLHVGNSGMIDIKVVAGILGNTSRHISGSPYKLDHLLQAGRPCLLEGGIAHIAMHPALTS